MLKEEMEKDEAAVGKKRRFDETIDCTTAAISNGTMTTTTTTTIKRNGNGQSHLFKRGGAKATKYSELLEQEKPDAKLPTREELRVKTTERAKEQFDLLVSAWSRQRKVSTSNIAVAIWDKKLKLAKVVKQKGKSLSKFGYSASSSAASGGGETVMTSIDAETENGGGAVYLFPEEVAFLVETERVCLFWQARGKGLEPASVKSIHGMLEECGVSMETYVTYAQLCRIGYVARRFGAPWVVPEQVKTNAKKNRGKDEMYLHRKMAGEGDWVFRGVDNNKSRIGDVDVDVDDEGKVKEGKKEDGDLNDVTVKKQKNADVAIEEKVEVNDDEEAEIVHCSGTRRWFYWSGSKHHPWIGPEIHASYARTQKVKLEERKKREKEKELLRREKEKLELMKMRDAGGKWPTFDVWRPNGNFKKSGPGEPDFRVAVCSERPPHGEEAELLWKRSKNVKIKIANVESGTIMLFDLEAGLAR